MSNNEEYKERLIEAFIFASEKPVSEASLKRLVSDDVDVKALLKKLQTYYAGRGVNLVEVGKSWAFRTAPDVSQSLNKEVKKGRLPSRAATEVLAIIAYHQPVTRAEIEEIRGVSLSKGTLDFLFELGWIRPKGRRQSPGRPTVWGTTDEFLDNFGLRRTSDLPGLEELKAAGLLATGPSIDLYGRDDSLFDIEATETPSNVEKGFLKRGKQSNDKETLMPLNEDLVEGPLPSELPDDNMES